MVYLIFGLVNVAANNTNGVYGTAGIVTETTLKTDLTPYYTLIGW